MTAHETRALIATLLHVESGNIGPALIASAPIDVRKAIQRRLGVADDGAVGPKTRAAWAALAGTPDALPWPPEAVAPHTGEFDERTEKNLATLNANAQAVFRPFMHAVIAHFSAKGIVAKAIDGSRTFAQQDALYAKGRTAPGPKVTNAKGGQSNHNYSCAVDLGLFKNGDYLEDSPLYLEIGPIARSHGLQWGGDWSGTFKDYPHVEAKQFKKAV